MRRETKMRTCLKCQKSFESTSLANRLCKGCNGKNKRISGKGVSVIAPMRKYHDDIS